MAVKNTTEIWVEERIFIFDCLLQFLRSSITDEKDPLTVLTITMLLHNLGESVDTALTKLENILQSLPDIQDSGYQRRDCLIASGYAYIAKQIQIDNPYFKNEVQLRINFASIRRWFDDSRLAAIVALLSENTQTSIDARQYLFST